MGLLLQVGLEQLELEADAARFAAQQEFGIGEGQPAGVGVQRQPGVGVRLQRGPGVGQALVVDVAGRRHGPILTATAPAPGRATG